VPDLTVLGKALGNGFPVAAVCGSDSLMRAVTKTWISSTLATEYVSLAAAGAVLDVFDQLDVAGHLARVGAHLFEGFRRIAERHRGVVRAVRGVPEMCYLQFTDDAVGGAVAAAAAERGVLVRRTAYNFVSLAHSPETVDHVLERLDEAIASVRPQC
jgi:4-aminobutyrate aminotransferase-like enzyme